NNSSWRPEACQECTCYSDVSICRPVHCPNPQCDFQRGEFLRIPANKCCPECVSSSQDSCQYEGVTYGHDSQWSPSPCSVCVCSKGSVSCHARPCPQVTCSPDQTPFIAAGDCCPKCGESCSWQGVGYRDGEEWEPGLCTRCVCSSGKAQCSVVECQQVACRPHENLVIQPGQCCPQCVSNPCLSAGTQYQHGEQWQKDACTACVCDRGQSKCHTDTCRPAVCDKQGLTKVRRAGRCCDECAPAKGSCLYEGEVRYHGDMWNGTGCEFCACNRGQVVCRKAECGHVGCPQESELVHLPGKCCPECCHASCSECRGPTQQDCLSCSDPAALLKDGVCVSECGAGYYNQEGICYCGSSCASCFPDNPKCMSCPAGTALHHGKCVTQCPAQHYMDSRSRCRCHMSCASCWGPSVAQCTSCPAGLLLHQGQCVEDCGDGLYPQDSSCHCHPSCRSCVGPLASDCRRCLKPEEVFLPQDFLLQRGVCIAACPAHSFLDGLQTCRCHPLCQTCSGPSQADCTSCPPGGALQSGYCTTGCQEGRFLCSSDCQRCTADLQTGVGSVCLWCKAARTWLLGDHCVSFCPSDHYAWHGACHPSCESCSGAGPLSCTSCPTKSVLLPSGLCAARCPVGYYDNGHRLCQDRQCLTCDTAGVCTSCRDPTKVLLFGECQYDSCAHQYYLNTTTRACRCDWSCNACKGPLRTDCLQCMEGYVLQDGVCAQGCSVGSYQDGDRCFCDDHCVKCNSPGKCLECQPPYATLQGQCVLQCGRNYYLDSSSQVCKCSSDCVQCDGVGRCLVCRDQTFLMEGYCTPDCGHGYYADQKTRTCHNRHSPVLHINGSLLVPIGGSAPLLPSLLEVRDPDSPSGRMSFQLVQEPNNGRLVLLTEEEAGENGGKTRRELHKDDTFTWAQLQRGRVHFTHLRNKATGEFTLRAADPQMFSQPAAVQVHAVSMQPPRVVTLAPLTLEEPGGLAAITKSVLHINDPDNPADVLVMVLEPPRHGRLTRLHGDRALSRFKLEELSREQIQYVHDGSAAEDGAVLQVNDGHSYRNVLLQVRIVQKPQDSPHLVSLPMTWVKEGGTVRLDKKYLQTDVKGVGADDIIYTILASEGQPKHEVVLVSMPADSPPEGWHPSLMDDQLFTPTASFTQQDVNDGTVWYRHFGSSYDSDSFQFQVSSDVSPLIQSDAQTFTIGVLPQMPGFPQLAPDCDLQITALEDQVTEVTPSALSFIDSGTPSEKLVYNVTKPLLPGQLLEHRDRPYKAVQHFTQADVNKGKIIYRPPAAPSHLQELYQYSFTLPESLSIYFTSDGEHTTPELDFVILPLSNHQQPPVFQVLDPLLEVQLGGQAAVGQQLAVSDADTAPDDLEFELVDAPIHGELMRRDDNVRMDTFSFADVTHQVLLYRHAGLSTQDDAMSFSVSDGISMATTVVQVTVLDGAGDGPQRDPAATLSLEVGEKSSTVIRRSHLAYTDNTSSDDQIHIQLVSVPMYGVLTRTSSQQEAQELREYSSFSQEDVNLHRIYVTSLETGSQPVTDVFHFVVHDEDSNRLDNQMCTITITASPRQPPVVTVQGGIKVQEGGRVLLSTNHITVSDVETPQTELQVWLVSPPKYGFIENTKRGGSRAVTPDVPFSVEDLVSDHVFYVQDSQQKASQDVFSFYISDGYSQTETFSVEINIQSKIDSELTVSVSSVHVEENSGVVVTNSSLSVYDGDKPENELVFTVVRIPTYKLRRRQFYSQPLENGRVLTQGSTFTYQDVLDRLLVYTPETVSGGADEMGFTLTDGTQTQTGLLQFTMDVRRSEGPRMTVNRGLQLPATSSKISEQNLKGSDVDSDNLKLRYILTKDPPAGKLQLGRGSHVEKVSVKGPVQSFTQEDVNQLLRFSHEKGEKGGSLSFKFNLVDPEGNKLIDQSFFISVLDHLPPSVVANKGLVLDENSVKKLTTLQLSASDQDSEPGELVYRITKQTSLGQLEHVTNPTRISSFTQADLASRSIQYVHTSEEEKHADQFSFTVSDGTNETFYITMKPVDDSLPLLQVPGMRVQEGVRKTITEFELKATDADTEYVVFTVVQPPRHGTIERSSNGQHYRQTGTFTMDDIYQNRISYNHDGSNSLKDRFTFTVADGTNVFFMVEEADKEIVTAAPQKFKIDILPVDDGTPRIVTNLGLQWLEYMNNKATNLITKKELLTMDPDTDDGQLVYEITAEPKHGFLESKLKPGNPVNTFTQDVNLGLIRYVLRQENVQETMDTFKFLVKDSKPNVVSDNVFHIQWSLISFEHKYNVSEKAGTVAVTVKRSGNLNQYAIVLCRTEQGSAVSTSSTGTRPEQQDYVEYAGQVQFDEREDTKVCTIVINDDKVFEGVESFHVELSMPVYALLGANTRAVVNINDTEDEPTLQFDKKTYHVNESSGFFSAPIERKDASSTVSALCYTVSKSAKGSSLHGLESGSDYKSRGMSGDNRVIFGPGVSMSTCDVKLVDDSEYELSEEFELVLSDASDNARVGDVSSAKVVIDGPNDASTVTLGNATFTFSEDAGTIEIPVLRQGSDLSSVTSVWCATRPLDPPSAIPGVDYIPSSKKVEFKPGKTEETCSLTIMDDIQNPSIEGPESFVIFLSSPQGAVLQEPYEADIVITDTFQDPTMQFGKTSYTVKEKDTVLHVPIIRTGDLSFKSSVRCFTRTMSAMVMDDFVERRNADESRITFLKGEKQVKNCTAHINDDSVFEPEEEFQLHLGTPQGDHWSGAMIGASDIVTITITNDEDPTIEFEQASYQVREPPGPDGVEALNIKVIRHGDLDRTSKIRCSTRDGSAQSGVDYNPNSRVLKFTPTDHIMFKVEILSNEDREWHESFSLVLGPDDPVEAVLGEITTATVTILDQEAAGSLILPAPPIQVVSVADYNHVQEVTKEGSKKTPSPGYPLVCVTPCDPHYPKFSVMKEHCEEAGINQTQVHFSWEVAAPTDSSGARSPFETVTDTTPYTSVNHKQVLDSIYFSRRFHVRCVAQARDKAGHLGTPLRSNIITIGTDGSICHTPVTTGTARGFQAQSFIATLKYLDVKHKEHPNSIHISVQIPHQDGMLPLVSTMPLHNLHFLLSESIYRQQHVCSNLVTIGELQGISSGFLDDVSYDSISLGPGYDRPYQFNPNVREAKSIQLYKHLNLKSCIWTFDAYYDMTELIDVCGGSVTADFQVRDSAQSFLTVQVPLYVSYIYVTAPRGWASLEHHTEMEFSFFYDTVLWRTIQTDSVLSARLQIIRIFIREDGRLVIEFKTHAKFRQFVLDHHTLPGHKSRLMAPDHLGGIEFDMQLLWSAQTFDSPYQLWRATSSYSKDYSGEYTVFLIPCTVQPTQPWIDPGDKPLSCTAHAPEFLVPIAFQQTNRPVPVVYSLNTEFQLCNNEKVFLLDPASADVSMAEMDYKGAFSMQTLYGRVLWNPEQNLNAAYRLQLEKVYLCTGRDGYVPFFDPTGTLYNEGPQYGCIQPNKHLKHRFLLLDRKQPDVCHKFFHDVPFEADFASDVPELQAMAAMPGVDGFTMKVDALYKVEAGHQWYLQVIYVIGPESRSSPRIQRSLTYQVSRSKRDLVDRSGRLTLDESLIYDNEGDQVKNGTNMKSLRLEAGPSATFNAHVGSSMGGGVAAITLLVLALLASCFLFRRCRRSAKKATKTPKAYEEYPLNTKVEVCMDKCVEKNFGTKHCTVRNVNINRNQEPNGKVKQVNLEVKIHNNLGDGTEV
uniref:Fraser extracellular matrix complex subunit 1 n=1 Tax=Poecilia latipinna TaxID=48699 RepID=A0A3B3VXF3_9TELE